MANVRIIDTTLRDANQSVWGATGLTTGMIAELAPKLDRVGYECAELIVSSTMLTSVRYLKEDPWRRIDTAVNAMPSTKLGFLTTGKRFISWYRTPDALLELAYRLLVRHGVRRIWIIDPMNIAADAVRAAGMAKKAGFEEVIVGIVYSISPIHTDDYFADRAEDYDDAESIDALYLKDAGGLLTPERLATLVPAINARLKRLEIREIHSHCNTGLSPRVVLDAADLGIDRIHCALDPVANGPSHPPAAQLVRNLRSRGHNVDIDDDALEIACQTIRRLACEQGLPESAPAVYDEDYFRHQIPGGMISTLARQLSEMNRLDMLPAIREEVVRVREDFGYPIVVTPFAQFIVTQAMMNVLSGERYAKIPDDVVSMVKGDFGAAPGPISPDVLDRVESQGQAREAPPEESLAQLRARFGSKISDEELLLRALMPKGQVDDAMGPANRSQASSLADELVTALARDKSAPLVTVARGETKVSLRR
jgi:oxaloacetate decarboxylase alpha subunit